MIESAWVSAIAGLQDEVSTGTNPTMQYKNPWLGSTCLDFGEFMQAWLTFLPTPDNGFEYIQLSNYLFRDNAAAIFFINRLVSRTGEEREYCPEIFDWTTRWLVARKKFMDSKESAKNLKTWIDYISANTTSPLTDYEVPIGGFKSFNDFFSRELKNDNEGANKPRPIANPNMDSIVIAPADSEINFILSDLDIETPLRIKTRLINTRSLLNNSPLANLFISGTAVSCVLLPNNYHRFHAPVTGDIVESMLVQGFYFGISGDRYFPNDMKYLLLYIYVN